LTRGSELKGNDEENLLAAVGRRALRLKWVVMTPRGCKRTSAHAEIYVFLEIAAATRVHTRAHASFKITNKSQAFTPTCYLAH
jgi:hypothetical protein